MKKCIFYLPYKLEEKAMGARMMRPRKMIQAFKDIGYDVVVITGISSERRKLIKMTKRRIHSDEIFDFMYTEASTQPTLLTDPKHLPDHPFLDYGFFSYVKAHGIKIGLFYPDIFWKIEIYGKKLPYWKKMGALMCYQYDIHMYKKLISRFYIADDKVCEYIKEDKLTEISCELPPGADDIIVHNKGYSNRDFTELPLKIFYVGGIGSYYQLGELIKAVARVDNCELTICCRDFEWINVKDEFEPYMEKGIHVVHKSGFELEKYYEVTDICSLLLQPNIYISMSKPFKTYEYLGHELPILSSKGTEIGEFVEENNIGWNVEYDADSIECVLREILNKPELISMKIDNCKNTKRKNLWTTRAQKVAEDLIAN